MRTLGWLLSLSFLGGAVSAGVTADTSPSRPVLPRDTGVAPPNRVLRAETPPLPAGTPVTAAQIPKSVRRAVVTDAAKRFRVSESSVVLVRAERVTWSDGSLGCAERGIVYTQSLVPGYVIAAKTVAGELLYHTDSREQVKICARARPLATTQAPAGR